MIGEVDEPSTPPMELAAAVVDAAAAPGESEAHANGQSEGRADVKAESDTREQQPHKSLDDESTVSNESFRVGTPPLAAPAADYVQQPADPAAAADPGAAAVPPVHYAPVPMPSVILPGHDALTSALLLATGAGGLQPLVFLQPHAAGLPVHAPPMLPPILSPFATHAPGAGSSAADGAALPPPPPMALAYGHGHAPGIFLPARPVHLAPTIAGWAEHGGASQSVVAHASGLLAPGHAGQVDTHHHAARAATLHVPPREHVPLHAPRRRRAARRSHLSVARCVPSLIVSLAASPSYHRH
jgi:hypothetical protein